MKTKNTGNWRKREKASLRIQKAKPHAKGNRLLPASSLLPACLASGLPTSTSYLRLQASSLHPASSHRRTFNRLIGKEKEQKRKKEKLDLLTPRVKINPNFSGVLSLFTPLHLFKIIKPKP